MATSATIVGERVSPTVYNYYPLTASWLGVIQIGCSIATGIILIVLFGFVAGLIFFVASSLQWLITGSFGIAAGIGKTACKIVTNLVMSVWATIISCTVFNIAMGLLTIAGELDKYGSGSLRNIISSENLRGCSIALMVFSVIEIVAAISSAIIDCHFVCFCCKQCCCQFDITTTDQVLVHTYNHQQFMQGHTTRTRSDDDVLLEHIVEIPGTSTLNGSRSLLIT